jgi:hypothetical protein
MFFGSLPIGRVRLSSRLENAEVMNAPTNVDLSDEFVEPLFVMDALVSARIVDADSRIPGVFAIGCDPEISEAVVGPIAVDVINMPNRPLARDVEPSQTMRHVEMTVDLDMPVPARLSAPRNITGRCIPRIDPPKERPGIGFVPQQATDFRGRETSLTVLWHSLRQPLMLLAIGLFARRFLRVVAN